MAIASVGTRGTGVRAGSSGNTITLTTTTGAIDASSNHFAILTVAADNLGTTDSNALNEHTSVTGGTGTWTKLGEYANGNGAALAGVTTSVWLFVPSGANAIGTVFTINLSGNATDAATNCWCFSKGAGNTISSVADDGGFGQDATTNFGSRTISGLSSTERLYLRALGRESSATSALTPSTSFTILTQIRSRNNSAAITLRGEFRINTSTGETSNPTGVGDAVDSSSFFVALAESTPSGQSVTAPLYTNTETFYAPTVALAQSLTVGLHSNTQSFYGPTLTQSTPLTVSLLTNTQTFYGPTVTPGTVTVTAPLLSLSQTFYSPSIRLNLAPGLVTNTSTFYNPSVHFQISTSVLTNTSSFFSPTVTQSQGLTVGLLTNTSQVFDHTISQFSGDQTLDVSLFTNTNTFESPFVIPVVIKIFIPQHGLVLGQGAR